MYRQKTSVMDYKNLCIVLGFNPKENSVGIFSKQYPQLENYCIDVDLEKQIINYGDKIQCDSKTTQNFSQPENFVVLECVNRLLEKGYLPENIVLEKTYPAGHGTSGRLDICVTRDDGSEYLLIECKTYNKEFDKEFTRMKKDGGQLFTYFKFSNKADVIMLYASELKGKEIIFCNEIIKIDDEYRTGDVKDFYEKWNKLTNKNGVFENWVRLYCFECKALTPEDLREIELEDSSFIFNQFLEILRHNVVSDKGNAFNKIFTLFLCKIFDETHTKPNEELAFQWFYTPYNYDGISYQPDDHISFQKRLTDLYKKGMKEFLEKEVTDISDAYFKQKYGDVDPNIREKFLNDLTEIRLKKNNEFAIKEVFDDNSFAENAKVVKEVVELLQRFKIRYATKQQYLSDFFELLLTTGLKQEAGQFFTPVPVAQFIIKSLPIDEIVEEKLKKGIKDEFLPHVIDYAAGSGHFITESMHELQRLTEKYDADNFFSETKKFIKIAKDYPYDWAFDYIYGVEKDYRLVKVGKVGCYLHGDGLAKVIHSDGLGGFEKTKEYDALLTKTDKDFPQDNKQFDVVISNPPYSVSAFKNNASKYYNEKDFELYNFLTDNSSEIECLFVERAKQLLKDGGVAGIILPSSILSNEGIYTKAREVILQHFEIIAITELGSNTFMATGTNTIVLFLRRVNNYHSIHLRKHIDEFFIKFQDVALNKTEKSFSKYIQHVWKTITFSDYVSLIKNMPNVTVENHEFYKNYRKTVEEKIESEIFVKNKSRKTSLTDEDIEKIKERIEKECWNTFIETEKDKILYFILAYPQTIVLVKTGEKDAEKRFLGYEFSNRRGSEGIHPMQRGKSIDECTKLFDDERFDNHEKASTYIHKAFSGDYNFPVHESLKNNISHVRLVDMLTFDRAGFTKNISTSVKKKVRYDEIWETDNLISIDEIAVIQKGTSITKEKTIEGNVPVIAGGKEFAYFHNIANRNGNIITVSASGAYSGFINYFENPIFASDCNTIQSKNEEKISTKLIYLFLKSIQEEIYGLQRGQAQPHVYAEDLIKIKIPLPSKEIQEKIVSEIEVLEKKEADAKAKIESLKNSISEIVEKIKGVNTKLYDITTKIGSGATPLGGEGVYKTSGITFIRSQNVYDGFFVENGLAYIDEEQAKKLEGVTVEKNDVLFNITGASIARCCVVKDKYLPARVNQHVSIIRTNQNALPKYVQLILVSKEYKDQLLQIGEGATSRQAITKSQLENFEIPLPSLSEQQKIVSEIEAIETQIAHFEQQLFEIPKQKEEVLKAYL